MLESLNWSVLKLFYKVLATGFLSGCLTFYFTSKMASTSAV